MSDKTRDLNSPVYFLKDQTMGVNEFKKGDIAELTKFYKALLKKKKIVRDATRVEIANNKK